MHHNGFESQANHFVGIYVIWIITTPDCDLLHLGCIEEAICGRRKSARSMRDAHTSSIRLVIHRRNVDMDLLHADKPHQLTHQPDFLSADEYKRRLHDQFLETRQLSLQAQGRIVAYHPQSGGDLDNK
jgi:hypothetical protein